MRKRCYCVRRRGVYVGPSTNIALRLRWNGLLRHLIPPQSRSAHDIYWLMKSLGMCLAFSERIRPNWVFRNPYRSMLAPRLSSNDEPVNIVIVLDADRFPGAIVYLVSSALHPQISDFFLLRSADFCTHRAVITPTPTYIWSLDTKRF